MRALRGERGMALAVVLMAMAILLAMVVEFAQGVHMNSDHLQNWHRLEQLSLAADSGVTVAVKGLQFAKEHNHTVLSESHSIPYALGEESVLVSVSVEDVSGKFNINRMVNNKKEQEDIYIFAFQRLLDELEIDDDVAYIIAGWIDGDPGPEPISRDAPLTSVEELLQVPGIDIETYAKLKPYIRVSTYTYDPDINVNLAEAPVLRTIWRPIDVESILEKRKEQLFNSKDNSLQLGESYNSASNTEKLSFGYGSDIYRIISTVSTLDGLERTIECVVTLQGQVLYWRES